MNNSLTLKFYSTYSMTKVASSSVCSFVQLFDPTEYDLGDIRVSVEEMVNNAIEYGYSDSIGLITVKVSWNLKKSEIRIVVRDYGKGIPDVRQATQPMFTTGGTSHSGMGFTIAESFMDTMRIRSTVGKGTSITMTKVLQSRKEMQSK